MRIFNTYGPRLRPGDGRVVSNFLVQALRGEPLTVYGDGTQTRSFCYVDDEIAGSSRCSTPTTSARSTSATPNEFTMLELAELVLEVTGSPSEIVFEPLPDRRPDAAPARHHAGRSGARLGAAGRASARGSSAPHDWYRSESVDASGPT